jgi:oligo-1,6-glucosidase
VYRYVQRAIALHHSSLAFTYGDYKDLDPEHPQVYAYTRTLSTPGKTAERFLVLLNWSEKPVDYTIPGDIKPVKLVLSNVPGAAAAQGQSVNLSGWEARVYSY